MIDASAGEARSEKIMLREALCLRAFRREPESASD